MERVSSDWGTLEGDFLVQKRNGSISYSKGIYDDWTVGWPQNTGVGSVFITDYIPIATLLYKAPRATPL